MGCFKLLLTGIWAATFQAAPASENPGSASQLSFQVQGVRDSVVLKGVAEPGMHLYSGIEIHRRGVKLFDSTTREEIEGFEGHTMREFQGKAGRQYVFTISDRPSPDKYWVLELRGDSVVSLGFTPNSTAEVFGDVDADGFVEVGGIEAYHDATGENSFRVFELRKGFPRDARLEKALREVGEADKRRRPPR